MQVQCISLGGRTSTVLIACLYLILHSAFLVVCLTSICNIFLLISLTPQANFVIMNRPREHLDSLLRWLGRREGARFLHVHPRNILIQVKHLYYNQLQTLNNSTTGARDPAHSSNCGQHSSYNLQSAHNLGRCKLPSN